MSRPPSLKDSLVIERGWEVKNEDLPSNTSRIRRTIFRAANAREPLSGYEIAELATGTGDAKGLSLVQQGIAVLRYAGFTFEKTSRERTIETKHGPRKVPDTLYLLTNPSHAPTEAQFAEVRQKVQGPARAGSKQATDEERKAKAREAKRESRARLRAERGTDRPKRPKAPAKTAAKKTAAKSKARNGTAVVPVPGNGLAALPHGNEWGGRELMAALPALGEGVRVRALVLNDDGSVSMMLRSEGQSWAVDVHGATAGAP